MDISIELDDNTKRIMQMLLDSGYEVYIVGGTVRDLIMRNMGFEVDLPTDMDLTTNAKPEDIKRVFRKFNLIYTGERHGTITIRYRKRNYDITTYRIDGEYLDGRRPESVQFVDNLTDDLARRDLTINAIAADIKGCIVDPFGGLDDIRRHVIRTVRDPRERFEEDALRLLRTIRFATRFNFEIEENTFRTIQNKAGEIKTKSVSNERIYTELSKTFVANVRLGVQLLMKSELFRHIFPEAFMALNELSETPSHFTDLLFEEEVNPILAWTLIHSVIPMTKRVSPKALEKIFRRFMGMPKSVRKHSVNLLNNLFPALRLFQERPNRGEIRRVILRSRKIYGHVHTENWANTPFDLLTIMKAVYRAMNNGRVPDHLDVIEQEFRTFTETYDSKKKLVNGEDAKSLGASGRSIKLLMALWDNFYYRMEGIGREDLLQLGKSLGLRRKISLEKYLENFSIDDFRGTSWEIADLKKELKMVDELLVKFGGLWVMVSDEGVPEIFGLEEYSGQDTGIYFSNRGVNLDSLDFPHS